MLNDEGMFTMAKSQKHNSNMYIQQPIYMYVPVCRCIYIHVVKTLMMEKEVISVFLFVHFCITVIIYYFYNQKNSQSF